MKEYDFEGKLGKQLGGTFQFLVHPAGGHLLALTATELVSAQFQAAK